MRRGALRRFDKLVKAAASVPVTVAWDRRTSSKPGEVKVDRRQKPPFTWDVADFVVVEQAADALESERLAPARHAPAKTTAGRGARKKPARQ